MKNYNKLASVLMEFEVKLIGFFMLCMLVFLGTFLFSSQYYKGSGLNFEFYITEMLQIEFRR